MRAKNPYKQTKEVPDWVIPALKVTLILVFVWQFKQQIPKDYWEDTPPATTSLPVETIEYSQLLGITTPFESHYLQWGNQQIHYLEPSQAFSAPFYGVSKEQVTELITANWELIYKGQELDITEVYAVFILQEGSPIFCDNKGKNCISNQLETAVQDFEMWLYLETEQQKKYFTKIKIGNPSKNKEAIKEAKAFWEKLIKREKYKEIDDLTVAKPVFKNNRYLFKWGDWERYVDRSLTEPRIKVDIATFKEWLNHHSPYLYKDDQYVPFSFSVGFWDRKRWDRNCFFLRSEETPSALDTYPCLERLQEEVAVGDYISLFIYQKENFLEQIKNSEWTNGVPSFILNGRRVNLYIAIELVAEPISPHQRPLELATSQFGFQLHSAAATGAIVKMDTTLLKNQDLFKHYQQSGSATVVHIPDYKTVRRVIHQEDEYIQADQIAKTHILMDTMYAVHTFPEFYDFDVLPPTINSRGLSTVLDKSCYWLEDYINYRDPFSIHIGKEPVKLLQTTITVIPKEGEVIQYITDNPDRYDIHSHLDRLAPETSVYFDAILFERANGERLAFPLAVALHLK